MLDIKVVLFYLLLFLLRFTFFLGQGITTNMFASSSSYYIQTPATDFKRFRFYFLLILEL